MSYILPALALIMLLSPSVAIAQKQAAGQMPVSFSWKSEYSPKGLRQWSQTAPDQWTEQFEDGTPERTFRVLGALSLNRQCTGLHLRSKAEPLEVFIPGGGCKSQWLLFRWVSIYTRNPQWVGQAEIQDIEYAPAQPGKSKP